MPLTQDEYRCLRDVAILYSGGLDSCAVALLTGEWTAGRVELLTYRHDYGTLFNHWSDRHTPELQRVLGPRVRHHLVDHTAVWNALGADRILREMLRWRGHWIVCLGCQEAMAACTAAFCLEHNITNAFICSSVGGEYAAMSMPITLERNGAFYARFGIRYNAPLLDLGIGKPEERALLRAHGLEAGWGVRRSHQGFQPICLLGFQHGLDIVFDVHTTYPPARVQAYLDEKAEVMEQVVRASLLAKGLDPDALIAANRRVYAEEESAMRRLEGRAQGAAGPGGIRA